RVSRLKLNDLLMQFDYPDANVHAEKRSVTSTPVQKLFLLNSPLVIGQAKALAARLGADEDEARIGRAYRMLFGREPTVEELSLGMDFVRRPEAAGGLTRWEHDAAVLVA